MDKRYEAVIDIGTNSIRLLIADIKAGQIHTVEKHICTTRIGEGVHKSGQLSQEAAVRTLEGIKTFKKQAEKWMIEKPFCFATSAVRDAANRQLFVRMVQEETGLEIEILSGEEEAELGFAGAVGTSQKLQGLIDIGGGSTEVIVGCCGKVKAARSMNIGAVRAMEHAPLGDPIRLGRIKEMEEWTRNAISQIQTMTEVEKVDNWWGIGGTITTMAAIELCLTQYSDESVQNHVLRKSSVADILKQLEQLTLAERKKIPGLQPERADIIIGGVVICHEFMKQFGLEKLQVSSRDNLEGYLLKKVLKKG